MKIYYKCSCCGKKNNLAELVLDTAWKEKDYPCLTSFLTCLQGNLKEKLYLTLDEFEGEKEKIPLPLQEQYILKKEKKRILTEEESRIETTDDWADIHPEMSKWKEEWQLLSFTYSQAKEWINIGIKPEEVEFANWLANIQELDPPTGLNNYDYEQLKRDYEATLDIEF